MPDSTPLPVSSPPPLPPVSEPPAIVVPVKKDQEDVNIEVYERVFQKCMRAAARIIGSANRENQVTVAAAIFDRFYNDQSSVNSGKTQAKAMIDGLTQVLEGRR